MSLTEFIGSLIIGFMLIAFYQDNFSRKLEIDREFNDI